MEWRIKYHKNAIKFLENLDSNRRKHVTDKLSEFKVLLQEGVFPIRTLDIKKLKGKWEGFFRLRIGNIRVIFRLDFSKNEILVYNIHFREKVY